MKQMDTILKAVGLKTRPALQERGGLLAASSAPSEKEEEEEEKQGVSPDGTAASSEEPSVVGRPDVGGPAEGEGLQGNEDYWCWEPVSAPRQECEVSPAKNQPSETLPSSSSS